MSIQLKRSLTSDIDQNYILKDGQIGIEKPVATNSASSPFLMKIGDGKSKYSELPQVNIGQRYTYELQVFGNFGYSETSVSIPEFPISMTGWSVNNRWIYVKSNYPYYKFVGRVYKFDTYTGEYTLVTDPVNQYQKNNVSYSVYVESGLGGGGWMDSNGVVLKANDTSSTSWFKNLEYPSSISISITGWYTDGFGILHTITNSSIVQMST